MDPWTALAQSGTLRTAAQRRAASYLAAKAQREAAELAAIAEREREQRLTKVEQRSTPRDPQTDARLAAIERQLTH